MFWFLRSKYKHINTVVTEVVSNHRKIITSEVLGVKSIVAAHVLELLPSCTCKITAGLCLYGYIHTRHGWTAMDGKCLWPSVFGMKKCYWDNKQPSTHLSTYTRSLLKEEKFKKSMKTSLSVHTEGQKNCVPMVRCSMSCHAMSSMNAFHHIGQKLERLAMHIIFLSVLTSFHSRRLCSVWT